MFPRQTHDDYEFEKTIFDHLIALKESEIVSTLNARTPYGCSRSRKVVRTVYVRFLATNINSDRVNKRQVPL